jgi:hypothetical protein
VKLLNRELRKEVFKMNCALLLSALLVLAWTGEGRSVLQFETFACVLKSVV